MSLWFSSDGNWGGETRRRRPFSANSSLSIDDSLFQNGTREPGGHGAIPVVVVVVAAAAAGKGGENIYAHVWPHNGAHVHMIPMKF